MTICGIACYNRKLEIITQLGYTYNGFFCCCCFLNLSSLIFGFCHFFTISYVYYICVDLCERSAATTTAASKIAAFRMWHPMSVKSHIHFVIRLILMTMIFYATDNNSSNSSGNDGGGGGFRRVYLSSFLYIYCRCFYETTQNLIQSTAISYTLESI